MKTAGGLAAGELLAQGKYRLTGSPRTAGATLGLSQNPQSCLPRDWPLFRRGPAGGLPSPGCWSVFPALPSCTFVPHYHSSCGFRTHVGASWFNISRGGKVEEERGFLNNHWQRREKRSMTSVATGFPNPFLLFFLPIGKVTFCVSLTRGQRTVLLVAPAWNQSSLSIWM